MCHKAIFKGSQFSTGRSFFDEIGQFSMEKGRFSTSNSDRGSFFDGGHFSPLQRQEISVYTSKMLKVARIYLLKIAGILLTQTIQIDHALCT